MHIPRSARVLRDIIRQLAAAAFLAIGSTACGDGDTRTAPRGVRGAPPAPKAEPVPKETKEAKHSEDPQEIRLSPAQYWAERLRAAPPPPTGMTLEQAESIHRYLDVERFNQAGDQGMRGGTDYAAAAEHLDIHVDVLEAADTYIHYERLKFLGEEVRTLLGGDAELRPDPYHPIQESAYMGTYTVHATIVLAACKNDEGLAEHAIAAAQRLVELVSPIADGFKVGRVKYRCERLGTEGDLQIGITWKKGSKIEARKACSGLRGKRPAKDTGYWCDRAWNDGAAVEHASSG